MKMKYLFIKKHKITNFPRRNFQFSLRNFLLQPFFPDFSSNLITRKNVLKNFWRIFLFFHKNILSCGQDFASKHLIWKL